MTDTTAAQNNDQHLVQVFKGVVGGSLTDVCDGRELHTFLENQRQFSDWIKQRVEQYGFEENLDFVLITQNSEIKAGRGGDRRSKDYHLSLDMAKELSMVENNHRGREARRYFIAMERQALVDLAAARSLPVEADQHFQRAFQGRAVFFGVEGGKLWASAANICTALGIGSTEKVTRNLPTHQLHRILRGTVRLRMIDMNAALRAADYCQTGQAKEYRRWIREVQADMADTDLNVQRIDRDNSLHPPQQPQSEVALAARKLLATTRFLCSFDLDGKMGLHEIPSNAVVIAQDRLAEFIGDHAGAPRATLGDILEAVGRRIKALH